MSDAYTPQSRLLAQIIAQQRNTPVHSIGQGLADVFGDVGSAYFQKQASDKDEQKKSDQAAVIAKMLTDATNPQYSALDAQVAQGQAPQGQMSGIQPSSTDSNGMFQPQTAQAALPAGSTTPLPQNQRLMQAFQSASAIDPKAALQGLPDAQSLASLFAKQVPKALPAVKPGESIPLQGPDGSISYNTAPGSAPIAGPIGEASAALKAGLITQKQYDDIVARQGREPGEGKISYRPMTPDEKKQWGIPPEAAASMGSNGKPDIINKGVPGSFLSEQGVSPDATPDEIRAKLSGTETGANLVRQADAVLSGREELQKISARSGETQGNQLRSVVYALDPGFNPMVGKQRQQVNTELNDVKDTAAGGKIASANKIINHAADLLPLAIDLKNTSILGNMGNAIGNAAVGAGAGGPMKTNLRSFSDVKGKLGAESAKLAGGGVASDTARAEVDHNYNTNDDLSGTIGAIGGTVEWTKGQIQPIVDRYNQAFGTHKDITDPLFMSPSSAAKLKVLEDTLAASKAGMPIDKAKLKATLTQLNNGAPAASTKDPSQMTDDEIRAALKARGK